MEAESPFQTIRFFLGAFCPTQNLGMTANSRKPGGRVLNNPAVEVRLETFVLGLVCQLPLSRLFCDVHRPKGDLIALPSVDPLAERSEA